MEHEGAEVVKNNMLGLWSHIIEFLPFLYWLFRFTVYGAGILSILESLTFN